MDDRTRLFNEIIKTYGQLDVLVSNAAISPVFGNLLDVRVIEAIDHEILF